MRLPISAYECPAPNSRSAWRPGERKLCEQLELLELLGGGMEVSRTPETVDQRASIRCVLRATRHVERQLALGLPNQTPVFASGDREEPADVALIWTDRDVVARDELLPRQRARVLGEVRCSGAEERPTMRCSRSACMA
jgi:hypothetical protein